MSSGRKGQFFMIGALFMCILFYLGAAPLIHVDESPGSDMARLSENLESEFPHALNLGLNESAPVATLYNFTKFAELMSSTRGIDLDVLHVVLSSRDAAMSVSVINVMGEAKTVGINVSGTYKALYVPDSSANSTTFTATGYTYDVTISYDAESADALMTTNKTWLYSAIYLQRGDDVVRKEIYA